MLELQRVGVYTTGAVDNVQYHNITISGYAGTGTTTLLNLLRNRLGDFGWVGYSGQKMRQYVPDDLKQDNQGHHSAEDYKPTIDRMTDYGIRQELEEQEGHIIESWLSGFMAQGVPHVLKVLLVCTNELVRAERLADRDKFETLADAMLKAFERLQKNSRRWESMYQQEWQDWVVTPGTLPMGVFPFFWHPALYDLVIDTAVCDADTCLKIVLDELGYPDVISVA